MERADQDEVSSDDTSSVFPIPTATPRHNLGPGPPKPILKRLDPRSHSLAPEARSSDYSRNPSRARGYHEASNTMPSERVPTEQMYHIPPPPMGAYAPVGNARSTLDAEQRPPSSYDPVDHRSARMSAHSSSTYGQGWPQLQGRMSSEYPYPSHPGASYDLSQRRSSKPAIPSIMIPDPIPYTDTWDDRAPPASPADRSASFLVPKAGGRAGRGDGSQSVFGRYGPEEVRRSYPAVHYDSTATFSPRASHTPLASPGHSPRLHPRDSLPSPRHGQPPGPSPSLHSHYGTASSLRPESTLRPDPQSPRYRTMSTAGSARQQSGMYLSPESAFGDALRPQTTLNRSNSARASRPRGPDENYHHGRARVLSETGSGSQRSRSTGAHETTFDVHNLDPQEAAWLSERGISIKERTDGKVQVRINPKKLGSSSRSRSGSDPAETGDFALRFDSLNVEGRAHQPGRHRVHERGYDTEDARERQSRSRAPSAYASSTSTTRGRSSTDVGYPPSAFVGDYDYPPPNPASRRTAGSAHPYSATTPTSAVGYPYGYGGPRDFDDTRGSRDLYAYLPPDVTVHQTYTTVEPGSPRTGKAPSSRHMDRHALPREQQKRASSYDPSDRRSSVASNAAAVGDDDPYFETYDLTVGSTGSRRVPVVPSYRPEDGSSRRSSSRERHLIVSPGPQAAVLKRPSEGSWAESEWEERRAALKYSPPRAVEREKSRYPRDATRTDHRRRLGSSRAASSRPSQRSTRVHDHYYADTGARSEEDDDAGGGVSTLIVEETVTSRGVTERSYWSEMRRSA
ncbi:hypothetical protein I317_06346 [Kwoniella heveanensis CBS 569]|nr:hypothetical protein I317_06346 [Kwoniella heveanensis CBS 569]